MQKPEAFCESACESGVAWEVKSAFALYFKVLKFSIFLYNWNHFLFKHLQSCNAHTSGTSYKYLEIL